jgi:2,4-dienoyl-CoA reductase-like NADH-dependent reductase (Old Yellow Enzyme family)
MTVEEIETVVRDFAEAAKAAVDVAGFDGVEIHGFVISCSLPISVLY